VGEFLASSLVVLGVKSYHTMSDLPIYRLIWGCPQSSLLLTFATGSQVRNNWSLNICSDHVCILFIWWEKFTLFLCVLGHGCVWIIVIFVDLENFLSIGYLSCTSEEWMQYPDHIIKFELIQKYSVEWYINSVGV
jgi:hypothetical protein